MSIDQTAVTALAQQWAEISSLLGPDLDAFERELLPLLRRLEASPSEVDAMRELITTLRKYPAAYKAVIAAASSAPKTYRGAEGATNSPIGGVAAPPKLVRYHVVPVFFATDRAWVGGDDYFSGQRGTLRFGKARVSIPDDHRLGNLEKPRWWRLEFRADPARHVVILDLEDINEHDAKARLGIELEQAGRDDILLFIHGYHTAFGDAVCLAAQFAYDLQFGGVTALYSWPSEGRIASYMIDENNAQWTLENFERALRFLLDTSGARNVYAVAHSMGSRVLSEGIRRIGSELGTPGWARLREMVFAAPDIDADSFRKFADSFHRLADRMTLYASSVDKALEASQRAHRYPRAGESGDNIVIADGVDSIDASSVDTSLVGHSYFADNRSVIGDIFNLFRSPGGPASDRFGIRTRQTPQGRYFCFRP